MQGEVFFYLTSSLMGDPYPLAPARKENDMDDFFDDCDGLEWQDWMIIGPLSEDIARERRDIERTRREWDDEFDNYWDMVNRKW